MKRKYLIISLFVICYLTFVISTSVGAMTGGGYSIVIPTVSSGGSISMEAGGYKVMDIKGQTVIGVSSMGANSVQLGGVYGEVGAGGIRIGGAPIGTVPLYISRDGTTANIKITWEASIKNPQFFIRSGGGIGVYTSDEGWVPIASYSDPAEFDNITVSGLSDGVLIHQGQIGGGVAEVYYKAIQPGIDPAGRNTDTRASNLASAWAVGKVNISISRRGTNGWNFVASPFKDRDIAEALYAKTSANFSDDDELRIWSETDKEFIGTVKRSGGAWQSFMLTRGKGYYFYRAVETPSPITATIIGEVDLSTITIPITRKGTTGWNFVGLPFPAKKTIGSMNPSGADVNDGIRIWDEVNKIFIEEIKQPWAGRELYIGKNYLYYRAVETPTFNWQIVW